MDFLLRPWKEEDAEVLSLIANNPAIASNMTDAFPHPYTKAHAMAFIKYARQHEPPHILCIEIEGDPAGGIGVHPQGDIYRLNAEIGYWLAEAYWGRGIMSRVIREMTRYAFSNWEIERLFARPFGRNIASRRALEKAGFILEARLHHTVIKNGNYEDELIYGIRRNPVDSSRKETG